MPPFMGPKKNIRTKNAHTKKKPQKVENSPAIPVAPRRAYFVPDPDWNPNFSGHAGSDDQANTDPHGTWYYE